LVRADAALHDRLTGRTGRPLTVAEVRKLAVTLAM
jgi:hypothetical protein